MHELVEVPLRRPRKIKDGKCPSHLDLIPRTYLGSSPLQLVRESSSVPKPLCGGGGGAPLPLRGGGRRRDSSSGEERGSRAGKRTVELIGVKLKKSKRGIVATASTTVQSQL